MLVGSDVTEGAQVISVLDCTMRDGGYYNDWDFSPEFVSDYLKLMHSLGVTHVELGFRFLRVQSHEGPWAYSPDSLIEDYAMASELNIGVMANLGELIFAPDTSLEQLFPTSSLVKFVRIACHFEELSQLPRIVEFIANKGFKVGVNLMQISERTSAELAVFADIVNELPIEFAYFADSLGALKPEDASVIAAALNDLLLVPFGIHAHDNRGLALQNTLAAMNAGATMLDSTLNGMGRGAGNTRTEDLLAELRSSGEIVFDQGCFASLNAFLNQHMLPMMSKYRWGPSLAYRLAADWGIHPTFVQELLRESGNGEAVIQSLQSLATQDSTRFNPLMIGEKPDDSSAILAALSANFSAAKGRDVLITGSGSTAALHRRHLQNFCQENGVTTLLLNQAWPDAQPQINSFRIGANKMRMGANYLGFWQSSDELVSPAAPPIGTAVLGPHSVVPLNLKPGEIDFRDGTVTVPNDLTLSYALALALSLEAKTIFLAGIDGYENGDIRNSDIIEVLSLFKAQRPAISIVSLTPTKFPVTAKSLYWRG